jgi:transposase
MPRDTKQHSQQFKEDAVRYVKEHPDITLEQCAQNRGIHQAYVFSEIYY